MSNDNPFNIIGNTKQQEMGAEVKESGESKDLTERIEKIISSSDVLLFMKGSPDFPQCGFSANVVGLLNHLKVKFQTFDILSDMDIREGVKQYANWPTYPQLYVDSKLVGGNDILTEMYESGDLKDLLSPYMEA